MNKRLFKILFGFFGMILIGLVSLYSIEYFTEDKTKNIVIKK